MEHKSAPQSISWFQTQYREGRLELRPPFQRKPVWTDKQRSALIESALMDIPIPEVYVQAEIGSDGTAHYAVVDGQQRLRTILQFIGIERDTDREGDEDNNHFVLNQLVTGSTFKDFSFAKLSPAQRLKFFQYEICVRLMYTSNTKQVEDVFKRLNKFTMPLKAQELRNATFHGAFANVSEQLADDEYWAVNRIVTASAIRRMADIEMMSDLLIGLLHGPQGGSAKIINAYYENYEQYEDCFPEQEAVVRLFGRTKALVQRLFPEISTTRWGNRADFYSLFIALAAYLQEFTIAKKDEKSVRDALAKFAVSVTAKLKTTNRSGAAGKYAAAIEKGSNDKARRQDRHEVVYDIIGKANT